MGKKKKTKTEVIESELSKEQTKILKAREEFYQDFTVPNLKEYHQATANFELQKDFSTLGDLTDRLDGLFSDEPESNMLARQLMQRGAGQDVQAAAQSQLQNLGAQAQEQAFSGARLAAIQQSNQAQLQRNRATQQEQGVRQAGVSALLSQAPQATSAGTPRIVQTPQQQSNVGLSALGGALGAGAGLLFNSLGSGGQSPQPFAGISDPSPTFDFNRGQGSMLA